MREVGIMSLSERQKKLAEQLFGYRSWKIKVNGKEYVHKPIKGK